MIPSSPLIRSALWMLGALTSFLLMAVAGRELSASMNTFEMLFFRSLIGLVIISVLIGKFGWRSVTSVQPKDQIIRNVIHFGGQFGWFFGISLLPLATVFAIEFTTPVWALIMATLFLGERLNRGRFTAVAAGLVGVIIILRPGSEIFDIASFAILAAAICYAATYIMTKKLTATDPPLAIIFYMCAVQLPFGLIPALFDWAQPGLNDVVWILLIGVTGLTSHYSLSRAFSLVDASLVIPLDFLRLPLAALIGFLLYNETLEPVILLGAAIIFAGNYYNIRLETRKAET